MKSIIRRLIDSGLTQIDIARSVGCSQPSVSEILSGKNKNPSSKVLIALIRLCQKQGVMYQDIWPELAEKGE